MQASTAPLFRRFVEDYVFEPVSESRSRLTWTIAVEPRRGLGFTTPINRLLLGSLLRDTRRHYGLR